MKYFLRRYKLELLTSLFAVASTVIAPSIPASPRIQVIVSSVIIFVSLLIIIFLKTREKDFYFISFKNRKNKDEWIGAGTFDYLRTEKCFLITNSETGFIFSSTLTWSDYRAAFDFKIIQSCVGCIIRAVDLANYIMVQIGTKGIRPHTRINGGWYIQEAKDVNLVFNNELSLDKWYKCFISCVNSEVNIRIVENKTIIFDRNWSIPFGALFFAFPKDEKDTNPLKIPFPISLDYGSVGFRDSGSEKALIRNLLIEKS